MAAYKKVLSRLGILTVLGMATMLMSNPAAATTCTQQCMAQHTACLNSCPPREIGCGLNCSIALRDCELACSN
jgi:hypothetical protein